MLSAIGKHKYPYLFILPFFVLFFVFQLVPLLWTIVISFTEWNGIGTPKNVGAANYIMLAGDKMFWNSFFNTFIYWITALVFILVFAMVLALIVNSLAQRTKSVFSTIVFLPNVCAAIAMGLIFRLLFDDTVGLINEIIILCRGNPQLWLTSTRLSKAPVIVLNVWRIRRGLCSFCIPVCLRSTATITMRRKLTVRDFCGNSYISRFRSSAILFFSVLSRLRSTHGKFSTNRTYCAVPARAIPLFFNICTKRDLRFLRWVMRRPSVASLCLYCCCCR